MLLLRIKLVGVIHFLFKYGKKYNVHSVAEFNVLIYTGKYKTLPRDCLIIRSFQMNQFQNVMGPTLCVRNCIYNLISRRKIILFSLRHSANYEKETTVTQKRYRMKITGIVQWIASGQRAFFYFTAKNRRSIITNFTSNLVKLCHGIQQKMISIFFQGYFSKCSYFHFVRNFCLF